MTIPLELLAPAGSPEAFFAAIEAGADSVYLGLPRFNARQRAKNFTEAQVAAATDAAHDAGRKVFVTLNTLLKEEDLAPAAESLFFADAIGADAAIVQDLGLVRIARRAGIEIPLHASTQMAVHNSWGVRMMEYLGFERVILARECTLGEIARIRKKTTVGLEVFAHGALCFSVSGRCLFSSYLGGRSANRGQCTQPCRRGFGVGGTKAAPFSMRDLSLIEHLPALAQAGVSTVKIEGRQRTAEYVDTVVRAYRRVIDAPDDRRMEAVKESAAELARDHGRPKTSGYLDAPAGENLIDAARSHGAGVFLGKVVRAQGKRLTVSSEIPVAPGDRLRVTDRFEGEGTAFNVAGVESEEADANLYTFNAPKKAAPGDLVFRTATAQRRRFGVPKKFAKIDQQRPLPDTKDAARALIRDLSREIRGLFPNPKKKTPTLRRIEFPDSVPAANALQRIGFDDLIVPALGGGAKRITGHARKGVVLSLPPTVFESDVPRIERAVAERVKAGNRRWTVRELGQLFFLGDIGGLDLIGDVELGVLNSQAAAALIELGLRTVCVSPETDAANLGRLLSGGRGAAFEVPVYLRPTLFHSRAALGGRSLQKVDGGKDGRFFVATGPHGTRVTPERAMSATGEIDKGPVTSARAMRIQLSSADLTRARLPVILDAIRHWKPIPGTTPFNMGRGGRLA